MCSRHGGEIIRIPVRLARHLDEVYVVLRRICSSPIAKNRDEFACMPRRDVFVCSPVYNSEIADSFKRRIPVKRQDFLSYQVPHKKVVVVASHTRFQNRSQDWISVVRSAFQSPRDVCLGFHVRGGGHDCCDAVGMTRCNEPGALPPIRVPNQNEARVLCEGWLGCECWVGCEDARKGGCSRKCVSRGGSVPVKAPACASRRIGDPAMLLARKRCM